jgi:hypothetical protein
MLRRYRAGYCPWFAAEDEVAAMIAALEQLLVMAPRLRSDCAVLAPPPGRHYMLRYPRSPSAAPADWCGRFDAAPLSEEVRITAVIDGGRIAQVESLPRLALEMELDLFAAPMMRIDGKRDGVGQPYYPYILLGVERGRGMIVGFRLLTALHGIEPMWSEIPAAFADLLIGAAVRPQRIFVHRPLLAKLLASLCEKQGIEIGLVRKLKNVAAARRSLIEMVAR